MIQRSAMLTLPGNDVEKRISLAEKKIKICTNAFSLVNRQKQSMRRACTFCHIRTSTASEAFQVCSRQRVGATTKQGKAADRARTAAMHLDK